MEMYLFIHDFTLAGDHDRRETAERSRQRS